MVFNLLTNKSGVPSKMIDFVASHPDFTLNREDVVGVIGKAAGFNFFSKLVNCGIFDESNDFGTQSQTLKRGSGMVKYYRVNPRQWRYINEFISQY